MNTPTIESTIYEANIDTHEGRNIQLYKTKRKLKKIPIMIAHKRITYLGNNWSKELDLVNENTNITRSN